MFDSPNSSKYNPEVLLGSGEAVAGLPLALMWCKPLKRSKRTSQRRKRATFSTEFSTAFAEIFRGRQVT
jgi:hypothetical protein